MSVQKTNISDEPELIIKRFRYLGEVIHQNGLEDEEVKSVVPDKERLQQKDNEPGAKFKTLQHSC